MPEKETGEAQLRSQRAEVFIVVGSSLVVYPAAHMPMVAKQNGARLIIINLGETPFDEYADVLIRGKAGETMERLLESVKARLESDS
jgi:NAD-dependent deacetylase